MQRHGDNETPTTLVTTTETVVAQIAPFNPSQPYPGVRISGFMNVTQGAGSTGGIIRIRQGSLTAPIVGIQDQQAGAAGATLSIPFDELDSVGSVLGYVVTAQQIGATGNGTVNDLAWTVEDY
jgi:hypothetical protein